MTEEEIRLENARLGKALWRKWGPYLSERQWGTVREDYSANGNAWDSISHEDSRSRTYRWGEDGLAGISDDKQQLCFAVALWNGHDPILKERLFGLTNQEGNHGEDVKEYYFYLDNLPSHAYMKYLYKYPQQAFPYEKLVRENKKRSRKEPEYELLDTGIFDENRYFDVFIEYAKVNEEDLLIQIHTINRGPEPADLHLIPTLWFRNTWAWQKTALKPEIKLSTNSSQDAPKTLQITHPILGEMWFYSEKAHEILFTDNETNKEKLFQVPNDSPFTKDAFHEYLIHGNKKAINSANQGNKAAAHYLISLPPSGESTIRLRLSKKPLPSDPFGKIFSDTFTARIQEAHDFYRMVTPCDLPEDMRNIQRQAFAGLLWNKQCYHYNVDRWLQGDPAGPTPPAQRKQGRNDDWKTLDAYDVFSMPDKWEYPWFAAWDLAFHTISLAMIDPDLAKNQLLLLTREWYMHPNGQIPAYEWSFSDVNPPVHAWAAMRIYQIEEKRYGRKDRAFLEKIFQKLILNFTWWVNRKDEGGRNIFEGGFLGLDNIGAFNRNEGPPGGGSLEQPDGTGWMGMYCINLLQIALELAADDPVYEDMATKFLEHFVYIADAINNTAGQKGLWDEKLGFYYEQLTTKDGCAIKIDENSIVGIVPLFAVATNHSKIHHLFPHYRERFKWLIENRPEYLKGAGDFRNFSSSGQLLISIVDSEKLKRILEKVLDEGQFLSPYGVRSLSRRLADHPYIFQLGKASFRLDYEPGESTTGLFGGNSNWRGPIWFPLNYLLIESLQKFDYYLGQDFKVELPSGSGHLAPLWEVASELSYRLIKIFLKDKNGYRPVYGKITKFQEDPHWRDYIFFHEYFHGDTGIGLGANHQTGWTGIIAKLIDQYGEYTLQNKPPQEYEGKRTGYL